MTNILETAMRLGCIVTFEVTDRGFEMRVESKTHEYKGQSFKGALLQERGIPASNIDWLAFERDAEALFWQVEKQYKENPEINAITR